MVQPDAKACCRLMALRNLQLEPDPRDSFLPSTKMAPHPFCRHLAEQNGEQMGAAKIAIEMARDLGLAQARNVERMANSALMLNPDYVAGMARYLEGIGGKRKKDD